MEITAMSRAAAMRYCGQKHSVSAAIISISDPNMVYTTSPYCTPENRVTDILPLSFCDADRPGKDVYGNETDGSDLMSDEDARIVALFVQRHLDDRIIVHCDAGISRSAGVAAAISKHFTGDDSEFFCSGQYRPNMWCYRKTLTALSESYTGQNAVNHRFNDKSRGK